MSDPVIKAASLLLAGIALAPALSPAHPASVFLPKVSLVDKIETHESVVLARPTRLEDPVYRVTAVLKSGESVERGNILEATLSQDPEAPETIEALMTSLLLTRRSEMDGWVIQSPAGLYLTPFFRQVLELPNGFEESDEIYLQRVRFFLPLLAHPDTRLANCAVAAIGKAPYVVVRELEPELDRTRLRQWIDDPNQEGWRALQFSLLGIGGNKEDASFLRSRIESIWADNNSQNLASLLVAYIELEGQEAARYIVDAYVKDRDRTFPEIKQALVALAMQGDEQDPLPREDVIEAFNWLIANRQPLAYLVVRDYLRWEHWEVTPELVALARERGYQVPYLRQRVIEFLEACPLPEAQQHISDLSQP